MEKIELLNTTYTPYIKFDQEGGKIELRGRSIPEDATTFYEPLLVWLDEYIEHPNDNGTMVFIDLEYFNSSTSKWLLEMFRKLNSLYKRNHYIIIKWYYYDQDLQEYGEDIQKYFGLPIFMIEK